MIMAGKLGPADPRGMAWNGADLLTATAGELLSHRLDHLPLSGDHFQHLGHIFAELAQTIAAAAGACCRRFDYHPARAAGVQ
jgi:hypothetical protein